MAEKIKLTLTYEFILTQAEFKDAKEHWAKFVEDNAAFDPVNMFYAMRLIKNPDKDSSKVEIIE